MKNFKRVIAIFLCVVTIIGSVSIMCSAKTSVRDEGWVELVIPTTVSNMTFSVPYNVLRDSEWVASRIMVKTEGKPIEDCFTVNMSLMTVAENPEDEKFAEMMSHFIDCEYLGFCTYDKEDNCYYAQCRITDSDFKYIYEHYGLQGMLEVLKYAPILYISKLVELKVNPKNYQYAHGTSK